MSAVLREEWRRGVVGATRGTVVCAARSTSRPKRRGLRRVGIELSGRRTVLAPLHLLENNVSEVRKAYRTLQWSPIDIIAGELTDCHCRILMSVHLEEGEPTIRLKPSLDHISEVLEQGNQVSLSGVRSQIANVASSLPGRSLIDNHLVRLNTLSREVVMTEWGCRGHAHGRHCLLLRDAGLAFLIRPVASDSPTSQPLSIHRGQRFLGILSLAESHEPIATSSSSLHIPHDARLGNRTKRRERLQQDFIIDFVTQITDKDVKVVGGVFLVGTVGLIGPVHSDLLLMDSAAVEGVHSTFGGSWVIVLDEAVVEALRVVVLVGDDFDTADMSGGFEDLLQNVFCDSWIEATNIQSSLIWLWGSSANGSARGHDIVRVDNSG